MSENEIFVLGPYLESIIHLTVSRFSNTIKSTYINYVTGHINLYAYYELISRNNSSCKHIYSCL